MQKSRIHILFEGYIANKLSKNEILELQELLGKEEDNVELKALVTQELEKGHDLEMESIDSDWLEGVEKQVVNTLEREKIKNIPKLRDLWFRIAAAVLLIFGLGFSVQYWVKNMREHSVQADVSPGGNKAVLRLADGTEVPLSEQQSEIIWGKEPLYADGSQVDGLLTEQLKMQDLEIRIPRGGTYKVILADGTKVWLNAETRLKSHFNEKEHIRELELDGEAYFEVAHQYIAQGSQKRSVPFLVKTPDYTIKVLGTSFNVSAYKGDASKTTLVEGSIEINIPTTNLKQLLKPNQQALFLNNTIAITEVESSNYTSWKDGTFNFSDENLEGILRQVARWYDVEIRFQNETLKQLTFEGIVPRYENLNTLLKALEKAGDVSFEIRDRVLLVKQN